MPLEGGRGLKEAHHVLLPAFCLVLGVGGLVADVDGLRFVLEVVLLRSVHLQIGNSERFTPTKANFVFRLGLHTFNSLKAGFVVKL